MFRYALFKEFIIDKIKEREGFLEIMSNTLLDVTLEVAQQERKRIVYRTSEGRKRAILQGCKFGRGSKLSLEEFKRVRPLGTSHVNFLILLYQQKMA